MRVFREGLSRMTRHFTVAFFAAAFMAVAPAARHAAAQGTASGLPIARIPQPVTANGQPLAAGAYEIRITMERPTLPSGVPSETQRWVEFLAGGAVAAREIAEVIPDDAASPAAGPPRAVVQLLKEGDYVRVSIRQSGVRYLIYLPTGNAPAAAPPPPAG